MIAGSRWVGLIISKTVALEVCSWLARVKPSGYSAVIVHPSQDYCMLSVGLIQSGIFLGPPLFKLELLICMIV